MRPRIVVFSPDPLLVVAIERTDTTGADELHLHAGGQGVWVARMARELGGDPVLCGFAGGETGAVVRGLLDGRGEARLVSSAEPTGSYVADRRGAERRLIAHAPAGPRSRHEVDELVSVACAAGVNADALVVCNPYPAETFPPDAYTQLVADVRDGGTPVLVDLSSPRLDAALQGGPTLVKLNDWELAQAVGGPVDGPRLLPAAEQLRARGAGIVVVTRGPEPAVAVTADGALEIAAPAFTRGHPEGCGDAMMGALAVALGSGASLESALTLGAAAGAANFLRRGLGSASREVVEELCQDVVVAAYPLAAASAS